MSWFLEMVGGLTCVMAAGITVAAGFVWVGDTYRKVTQYHMCERHMKRADTFERENTELKAKLEALQQGGPFR